MQFHVLKNAAIDETPRRVTPVTSSVMETFNGSHLPLLKEECGPGEGCVCEDGCAI